MHDDQQAAAARRILEARRTAAKMPPLPERSRPGTIDEGYDVQAALHDLRIADGDRLAGWKLGCTTKLMQDMLGIPHPCAGGIMAADVHDSGAVLPWSAFAAPGVECEIAFELGDSIPADGAPWTRDEVAERIAACMPAIEVVDNRAIDIKAMGVPTLVADDFFQAGAVLGPKTEDWKGLDLAAAAGSLRIGDAEPVAGTGADIMGHPLEPLAWLANQRAERGQGIARGAIVLTGSMVAVQWLSAPALVRVENDRLGAVEVRFQD